ncbi:hypothetical protein G5B47_12610 [Paenibacillus sp. 7124]|uniref:Uncharacterized protein n=1 Tax=Paenibacillus apii TaxID=1850370 RepID=A0A6M1PI73_9BACL|nr:hypothetical protein [Paenibacillus apii]NGM83257.1 hypothetical protein [Paenibacillus apii]NJJ38904.1 hypothetical protein [Paenibacillus apii]
MDFDQVKFLTEFKNRLNEDLKTLSTSESEHETRIQSLQNQLQNAIESGTNATVGTLPVTVFLEQQIKIAKSNLTAFQNTRRERELEIQEQIKMVDESLEILLR